MFKKNIITNNLFDSIYKKIEDLKTEVGHNEKFEQIFKLEIECKDINLKIKEIIINIEDYIKKNYGIKDIKEIKLNETNDFDLNEKFVIYSELKEFDNKINEKIKYLKNNDKKFVELKNSIKNHENNVNELINKMEKLIKKTAELIKLSDIFDSYKLELIKIVGNKSEYDEYPDIFKKESISDFTLKDLFEFLETNLKNNNYSIIK